MHGAGFACPILEPVREELQAPCHLEAKLSEFDTDNLNDRAIQPKSTPLVSLPPVVWAILVVILAIHTVTWAGGPHWQAWAQYNFAFIPARFASAPFPQPPGAAWWSLLTYAALHADWSHVGTNSLWLAVFSKPVAMRLGALRYLILLSGSVIAGAGAGLVVHWGQPIIMVGISAGVSGVLAASMPLMHGQFQNESHHIRPLKPIALLKNPRALSFTAMFLGLSILTASSQYLTGTAFLEERVIAWEAHIAGFIAGLLLFYSLDRSAISAHHNA